MTRIIAGSVGGRKILVPPAGTRPTSERVREALFSSLEASTGLDGLYVLDLCAGSGALGLEALSRGASQALFVESDRRAATAVSRNLTALGLTKVGTLRVSPVASVLEVPADRSYDLVFVDPPYDLPNTEVEGWLAAAERNGWLSDDVTIVVERGRDRRKRGFEWPAPLTGLRERRYGDTVLHLGVRYGPGS
jgi:16S rRNA (guanine966-N2)-methyltransferase